MIGDNETGYRILPGAGQASSGTMLDVRIDFGFLPALILMGLLLVILPVTSAGYEDDFDHSHSVFTDVLENYVSKGLVNYKALKENRQSLDFYLDILAEIDPRGYTEWTREQKITLWINAYNAYTLKVIIDHYPIETSWLADPLGHYPDNSIRQIRGVWDDYYWPVMGKEFSFNQMEHEILRKKLIEPRIHFVLVCASKGCPLLESRAFEAKDLNERLDKAAVNYIYRDRKVRIDRQNKVMALPQIFKWFAEDFQIAPEHTGMFGKHPSDIRGILGWVYRYANRQDREFLSEETFDITYLYYDWALNEQ